MKNRIATISRATKETEISVELNLDGNGIYKIDTGIGFLNHMLELFSKNSLINLKIKAKGDLKVDEHHTVEDVGIVLGQAIKQALGDKKGITRYGSMLLPMDECLIECAIDLSGRNYFVWNINFTRKNLGDMPTELFEDFFRALSDNLGANIHLNLRYGRNNHHIIEGAFKAFSRALKQAITLDPRLKNALPSTKGIL